MREVRVTCESVLSVFISPISTGVRIRAKAGVKARVKIGVKAGVSSPLVVECVCQSVENHGTHLCVVRESRETHLQS